MIVRKFVEGVENKYFSNYNLDKKLFFQLQISLTARYNQIDSEHIYFSDYDLKKNYLDVLNAMAFAKRYFTKYYNDNSIENEYH